MFVIAQEVYALSGGHFDVCVRQLTLVLCGLLRAKSDGGRAATLVLVSEDLTKFDRSFTQSLQKSEIN